MEEGTLAERALFIVAAKTYSYLDPHETEYVQTNFSLNQVNKHLNKKLSNPIIARDIITDSRKNRGYFNTYIVRSFTFPGARKCRALSNQLYDRNLQEHRVKELYENGAIIDFSVNEGDGHYPTTGLQTYPLEYWCYNSENPRNKDRSIKIIKGMLALGANPNDSKHQPLLECIINVDNPDLFEFVLTNYKSTISKSTWSFYKGSRKETYLNLLLEHATPEELTEGLISCFPSYNDTPISYNPELMQNFIRKGANPTVALCCLMKRLPYLTCPTNHQHPFVKNLIFLCNNGASDREALKKMEFIRDIFDLMINTMKINPQSDSGKTEI
jgi:hypothetical protein